MEGLTKGDLLATVDRLDHRLRFVWDYDVNSHLHVAPVCLPQYALILCVTLERQCTCSEFKTVNSLGGIVCQEGDLFNVGEMTVEAAIDTQHPGISAQHYQAQCCMRLLTEYLIQEAKLNCLEQSS